MRILKDHRFWTGAIAGIIGYYIYTHHLKGKLGG